MTRNMDLGSDYAPALTSHDAQSFAQGVTTIYNDIAASNIAERAAGIASEIQETMPSVVSLQEVSLVQRCRQCPQELQTSKGSGDQSSGIVSKCRGRTS